MIRRSVSMPSMRGISRSSVTTSGRSSSIFFRAKAPSMAVPTTSMEGSRARIAGISFRIKAESSTTRTRMRVAHAMAPRGMARERRESTAGTFRIRTTVPSPRIEAPLTRSLEMMSRRQRLDDQFFFADQAVHEQAETFFGGANDDDKVLLFLRAAVSTA